MKDYKIAKYGKTKIRDSVIEKLEKGDILDAKYIKTQGNAT
ncbi:hypothetical protein ACWIWK_03955 [Helicobacter sp. 23-1048]